MASNHEIEFQKDLDRTTEFFKHLDPKLVAPSLDVAREIGDSMWRTDDVYRIFHSSFKMYRFSVYVYTMVAAMLAPLGFSPADKEEDQNLHDLISALEYWRFDPMFITMVREAIFTKFNPATQSDTWVPDATKMTSGFLVAREVALASLHAMEGIVTGKGFFAGHGVLNPRDALFLEVWGPIGMTFRYAGHKDTAKAVVEEARATMKAKLDQ